MRKRSSRPSVPATKTTARAAIAAVAATAIAAPLLVTTTPAEAGVAPYFASCADLLKKWPNGVAKGPVAANKAVRDGYSRPAYGPRAKAVYWENHSRLDRDHDGTACENG